MKPLASRGRVVAEPELAVVPEEVPAAEHTVWEGHGLPVGDGVPGAAALGVAPEYAGALMGVVHDVRQGYL